MTAEPNEKPLRILMLEDHAHDAALAAAELRHAGLAAEFEIVSERAAFIGALERNPQLIIADYAVPGFGGPEALKLVRARAGDLPFIIFSGTIGEDRAVEMMKAGATDYVLKDRVARLPQGINKALENQRLRHRQAAAERALRATVDSALDCIVTVDERSTILEFNPAAERTFGWSRAEAIGQLLTDTIIPERYRAGHERGMAALVATGRPHLMGRRIELAGLRADGSEFPLELTIGQITSEGPALFTAFMRDITEHVHAEGKLRAQEEQYRVLFQSNPNAMWVYDLKDFRILAANDAAVVQYGYSHEEFLELSLMALRPPEDRERVLNAISVEGAAARHAGTWEHLQKDGSRILVDVYTSPTTFENRPARMAVLLNVTEQKRADEALRASEERFSSAFEFAPMGMAIVSTDGRWSKVNQALCDLLGYSRLELTGRHFAEFTHPDSREADLTGMRRFLAGEIRFYQTQKRYLHKAGNDVWVSLSVSLVRNADGSPLHFISQLKDITARKEAEAFAENSRREQAALAAQLETERERLVVAQRVAKVGSWEEDLATEAVIWSEETYRIFEVMPDDYQPTHEGFLAFVHPDDRAAVAEAFTGSLKQGLPAPFEHRIVVGDGRIKFVEERWAIDRAEDGTALRCIGTCQDITDRHQSEAAVRAAEEKYRSIFNNASEGIFQTTLEGAFVSANPALARMVGFDSPEQLIRERRDVGNQSYSDPAKRQQFKRLIEKHGAVNDFEYEVNCRDGSVICVSENVRIVRDEAGKALYYEGSVRDVSESKRVARELEELNKQLLETSRQAGMAEVATSVLHNVGNVLNSVNISCAVISEKVRKSRVATVTKTAELVRSHADDLATFFATDPAGQKLPEFLGKLAERLADEQAAILAEVQSLSQNIAHIKEIVAVQQSYANVRGLRETLPITGLIEDALRINAESLSRHQVEIVRDFAELGPTSLDKHKVLQILVNLVRNAKHALVDSKRENKRLTVRVGPCKDGWFAATVEDNGVGIEPQNMTRIFSHGFTTKKDGHGFGLHSGVLAAREMGGSLTVQSEGAGQGATFTLELPCDGGTSSQ